VAVPQRSAIHWVLEAGPLGALLAIFGVVSVDWKNLPDRVPRHFNWLGNPDGWGGKNGLLLLPLIALGIYILLTIASRYQKRINIPISVDRDAPEVQSLLLGMSILLKTIVLYIFLYLAWANVNIAMGRRDSLGKPFVPACLAAVFVPMGLYMFKLRRYRE
jgi:uncharacterized membrane protein YidH (DUF202 family)